MYTTSRVPPLLSVLAWLAPVACSLSFAPLLDGNGYVFTAAWLALGPLLAALALRWLGTPQPWVFLGQLVALALWATLLHFPETGVAGVLPTPGTLLALSDGVTAGVETANAYAPPAPATTGLVLMVSIAVAICYLVVDALGVWCGLVPLTGLPLLALYTVPAALAPDGVPTLVFLPGAAAFVLLLGYDERERLVHWGRQISTVTGLRPDDERRLNAGTVNAAATRVGAVALGSAAVLPLFVPVLPHGLLDGGPGSGDGSGEVQVTNPIVDLRRDMVERSDDVALRVRTRSGGASYFRLAVLDEFDGVRWKFSDRDVDGKFDLRGGLSAPPGLAGSVRTRSQRYLVDVSSQFGSDWLPAPYAPTRVTVGGQWRYDPATLDIVAGTDDESTAGRSYSVSAMSVYPTFEQLDTAGGAPTSVSGRYTDVPDEVPSQVREMAERIAATGGSRFQRAVLLQDWFRFEGGFRYSLKAPDGHSGDDILAFLNNKVGYCEQFAAAMAVMARELDIPARVAVGFLHASAVRDRGDGAPGAGGLFEYTFADMHAWPELYFEGVGWVRFEPTPAARPGAAAPAYTAGHAANEQQLPTDQPTLAPTVPTPAGPDPRLDPGAVPPQAALHEGISRWWFVAGGVTAVILLVPAVSRVVLRRRRLSAVGHDPVQRAEAVWAELRDSMRDLGYDWPVETPRRTATRVLPLVRRREGAESALRRLTLTVERARFARGPDDGSTLRHDLALVVDALKARESRWDLCKAALLPRSLRGAYRRANRRETQRFRSLTLDADASALQSVP